MVSSGLSTGGLTPEETTAITPFAAHVRDNALAIIHTVFGKEADVASATVNSIRGEDIETTLAGDYVLVEVSLQSESGESWPCLTLLHPEEIAAAFDLGEPADDGDWSAQTEKLINPVELLVEAVNAQLGPDGVAGATFTKPSVRTVSLPEDAATLLIAPEEQMVELSYQLTVAGIGDLAAVTLAPVEMARRLAGDPATAAAAGGAARVPDELLDQPADLFANPTGRTPIDLLDDVPPLPESTSGGMEMSANAPTSIASAQGARRGPPADPGVVRPVQFQQFGDAGEGEAASNIDLILDVNLRVTVELGRASKTIREILELGPGVVVELDKLAGEPVDILVNDKPIAKGEVVVMDENFAVRVTDIVSPQKRIASLR